MTPEQRQAARARCEAATPGPWKAGRRDMLSYHGDGSGPFKNVYAYDPNGEMHLGERLDAVVCEAFDAVECDCRDNADFIAHARIDLPAALDALEAAEAEIARLRAVCRELREQVIVGDLAALELVNGFTWTKQREKQYRDYADAETKKLIGEESCES